MTRIVCLLLLALLALVACSTGSNDYIRATIDGKPMRFTVLAQAMISGDRGIMENMSLLAQREQGAPSPSFLINMQTPGVALRPGRYSARTTRIEDPRPGERQTDNLVAQYFVPGPSRYMSDRTRNAVIHDFELHITGLDETRIEGTFSGQLRNHDGGVVTVTAGQFSLPVEYLDAAPEI
jgi:hypothetical protein